ncbi:MAG: S1 family peptidase [Chitinophagaceae bacterium]
MKKQINKLKEKIELYFTDNLSIIDKNAFEQALLKIPNEMLDNEENLLFIKSLLIYKQHKQLKHKYKSIAPYKQNLCNHIQYLWYNQKITISIAACIGFLIALITGITYNFFSGIKEEEKINLLSKKIEQVEYYQKNNISSENTNTTSVPNSVIAKSSGTGFLINTGLILTSLHTLKKADSIFIVDTKDVFYKATVILKLDSLDVAVLKIEDKSFLSKYKHIPYNFKSQEEVLGEHLFSLGYPGTNLNYTEGFIASTENHTNQHTYNLFLPANPGTSGSPVINKHGEVVGIVASKKQKVENSVLAYKSSAISKELKKNNIIPHQNNIIRSISKRQKINKVSNYVYRIYCY